MEEKRKGPGRCWNKEKKVTYISPLMGSLSKQYFSLVWVPAKLQRSASACYVKLSEWRMELMMMVMRWMRIKIIMAVLSFPLTLSPWSGLFHLQSCMLKYIQLSSLDWWVLSLYNALPLSHKIPVSLVQHCGRPQYMCIFVFSFVNTDSPPIQLKVQVMYHQTCVAHVPPMAQVMIRVPSFWASLRSMAHTMLLRQVIRITRRKWKQILVIPLLYLSLTLSPFQPQEPQLKAVLWVLSEVGHSGPSQMSHSSRCIYFLLTLCLHTFACLRFRGI